MKLSIFFTLTFAFSVAASQHSQKRISFRRALGDAGLRDDSDTMDLRRYLQSEECVNDTSDLYTAELDALEEDFDVEFDAKTDSCFDDAADDATDLECNLDVSSGPAARAFTDGCKAAGGSVVHYDLELSCTGSDSFGNDFSASIDWDNNIICVAPSCRDELGEFEKFGEGVAEAEEESFETQFAEYNPTCTSDFDANLASASFVAHMSFTSTLITVGGALLWILI